MSECKCPNCGHEFDAANDAGTGGSNAEREILVRVPERHFRLMYKTFREMETKLGMYGYGELANMLKPYGKLFNEDWELLRYFDDGALALAMMGVTNGYPASLRIVTKNDDRCFVYIDFTMDSGDVKPLKVSEAMRTEVADRAQAYFADLFERLSPT